MGVCDPGAARLVLGERLLPGRVPPAHQWQAYSLVSSGLVLLLSLGYPRTHDPVSALSALNSQAGITIPGSYSFYKHTDNLRVPPFDFV